MSIGSAGAQATLGHMIVAPLIVNSDLTLPAARVVVHARTTTTRTITMPDAGDALPLVPYIIKLESDSGNLTIAFPGAGFNPGDIVLTAVDDSAILMSDGTYWFVINEVST